MNGSHMNSTEQFEAIVNEHYEPLYRFALSLTRAEPDACDLTQQTFYTWARKGHQLRDLSKVKTWLYTTLHRAFLQARRRQTRFPHHNLEEVEEQLPTFSPQLADHVDSSHVLSALAKVDEHFQPAVALFYLEDCSYRDIADILEVPLGTVKSRLARGIAQLREIFLSDGSWAATHNRNGISAGPTADNLAVSPENNFPRQPRARLETRSGRGYDERDYSPTLLREPIGLE
jgi:RNA polymerase sigma factor (sigma-70 family)